jgi:hypothetical protein
MMFNLFKLAEMRAAADEEEPSGALVVDSASGPAVPVSQPLGDDTIRQLGSKEAIDAVAQARDRVAAAR